MTSDQTSEAARNGQLKTPVEARQAVKTRHVRWVLAISLTLTVVALGGALAWYASAEHHGQGATIEQQRPNG
jgi:hypothetical protein